MIKVWEIKLRTFLASGLWGVGLFFGFIENIFEDLGNKVSGIHYLNL